MSSKKGPAAVLGAAVTVLIRRSQPLHDPVQCHELDDHQVPQVLKPSASAAIVAGGIGGLTAGLALLRAGFDVRVYEQANRLSEAGAGLQLAPNCTRILRRLGLLAAVERIAVRPTTFEFRRRDDGRLLSATPLGDSIEQAHGAPWLNAHRADFVALLARGFPAERVQTGAAVRVARASGRSRRDPFRGRVECHGRPGGGRRRHPLGGASGAVRCR